MLIEFKVKNFLSFEEEEVFSMIAGKGRGFSERVYKDNQHKLLKFSALFGSNGSGKSNFVKAIAFSRNYILRENNRAIIQKYYKLNPNCKNTPSLFSYKIKVNGLTYTYGFEIILSNNEIINEWLIANKRTDEVIFKHERLTNNLIVGNSIKNNVFIERLNLYAESLSSDNNTLFLNFINKYKKLHIDFPESKVFQDIYNWFNYKLKVKSPDSPFSDYAYFISEKNMDDILKFFSDFDLSISNYDFAKCSKEQIASNLPKEVFIDLFTNIEKELYLGNNVRENRIMFGVNDDFFIAKLVDDEIVFETLIFYHENSSIPFTINEESDGTKKILKLLEMLFQEDDSVVYIVDEIDRCLHPLLTYNFINAYLEKAVNKSCQLIATTHESILLDFKLLRKDEIGLISKKEGSSKIESLGDTQIRSDKVLVKEYLLGQKGTPNIINNAYKS